MLQLLGRLGFIVVDAWFWKFRAAAAPLSARSTRRRLCGGRSFRLAKLSTEGIKVTLSLAQTAGKPRLFSVVPSLDTPVCSIQTKKFNEALAALGDRVACYTVSMDLPFAQGRFCGAEGIKNLKTMSDTHDQSFGKNYGVLIEGLAMPLLSRALFVVDAGGTIKHVEYVPEIATEPNYEAALAALKAC